MMKEIVVVGHNVHWVMGTHLLTPGTFIFAICHDSSAFLSLQPYCLLLFLLLLLLSSRKNKNTKKNPLLFIDALPFIFIVIVRWRVIRDYDMMMWIFVGCDCTDPSLIHFFFCLMSDSKIILLDHLRRTMDRDRMLMSGRAAHHHHQTEIH